MSNTTKITGNFLQIKGLDADWSLVGDLDKNFDKSGIRVKSIKFIPSAADDIMIIKEGDPGYATTALLITGQSATAPELFRVKCIDLYDQRIEYFGGDRGRIMRPFIEIANCTFSTAGNARVEFELA